MNRLLVIRLSAMGDVAMTVPVIAQLLVQYPGIEMDILTRSSFHAIFPKHERIHFIEIDLAGQHKGFLGLLRLFKKLKKNKYSAVADLHDVLRSQVIRTLFKLSGTPIASIDKGRKQKSQLTRKKNKKLRQLTTTHQRYANVFHKLGYPVQLIDEELIRHTGIKIGIAPFAAHREKMWPLELTRQLILRLLTSTDCEIVLFGGGQDETEVLNDIAATSPRITSTADESLETQLQLMSNLCVLVSMDSANMHLASNLRIPVVSIWGATHPFAGFLGFNQSTSNCIQRTDLDCRPCSVFGNKTCWRGDWACLEIEIDQVHHRIIELISE